MTILADLPDATPEASEADLIFVREPGTPPNRRRTFGLCGATCSA